MCQVIITFRQQKLSIFKLSLTCISTMGLGCSLAVEEVRSGSITEVDEATLHKNLIEMKRHYYGGGLKSRRKGATIVTH